MQCATWPTLEIRTVKKDASVVNETCNHLTVLLGLCRSVLALGLELPLVISKTLRCFFYALAIFFITEVCAVTAAALYELAGVFVKHAFATRTKDARPVAFEKCDVEHVDPLTGLIFKAEPLVGVCRDRSHRENLVGVALWG